MYKVDLDELEKLARKAVESISRTYDHKIRCGIEIPRGEDEAWFYVAGDEPNDYSIINMRRVEDILEAYEESLIGEKRARLHNLLIPRDLNEGEKINLIKHFIIATGEIVEHRRKYQGGKAVK